MGTVETSPLPISFASLAAAGGHSGAGDRTRTDKPL